MKVARKKAIKILATRGPIKSEDLALALWPRSKAWRMPGAMPMAMRFFIEKMKQDGLLLETELGLMLSSVGLRERDRLFPIAD